MALAAGILATCAAGATADPFCISGGRSGPLTAHIRRTADPVAAAAALRRLTTARRSCTSCHIDAGVWFLKPNTPPRWPLNAYGHALTILGPGLPPFAGGNAAASAAAYARVDRVPVDPTVADAPTYGDRIRRGLPPQPLFPLEEYEAAAAAELRIARPPATLDFKEALTLALTTTSPVLQASEVAAIDAGTAGALARFAGPVLMLGLRSLPADVAGRLAASQADTVWLHSLPAIEPEAAAALVPLRGELVLTGLERLDAADLAAKLAARPGRLALPFLRSLAPAAARALVARTGATCLESLAEVPAETQAALASAQGILDLPALRRLDSPALARKLAASPNVQLGGLESLSVEIARILVEPAPFREGLVLPLAALEPGVVAVLADNPKAVGRLTVLGREVSPEQVRAIGGLPLEGTLFAEVIDPSAELAAAAAEVGVVFPNLRRLDSAPLATALVRRADSFRFVCLESVREISAAAAIEVAKHDPRESLRLSSLAALSAEQAERLLTTPRSAILLPVLEEISTASLARLLSEQTRPIAAQRTASLLLGVSRLPPGPFAPPLASRQERARFDFSLPALATLSADDARNLVASMRPGTDYLAISVAELAPEAAAVLAQWPGRLFIGGLRSLTPAVAAALAPCGENVQLNLDCCATLDAETAGRLAGCKANYSLNGLRTLTPEVAAVIRNRKWALRLPALETIDPQVAAELVKGPLVGLSGLSSLDPEVAELLVSCPTWEPQLPALTSLTPETAAVLAKVKPPKELFLAGLTSLDPETARALAACPRWRPLLPALLSIEPETVAALAACKTPFSLAGLRGVTPELAAALVGCQAWDGRLPGITSLETTDAVAIAKALARRQGRLELRNLRRLSPRTLAALEQKPDLVMPAVEALTLIPEPAGGTADDFSRPTD